MAGKNKDKAADEKPTNGEIEAPEGFEDIGAIDGIQTWWRPKEGAVVHGRLMGRHTRHTGKKQAFYQVKLISSASGIQGKGDEAEMVELGKGDVLNVNETKTLQSLHTLSADDGVYDVFIKVLEKVDIGGGHTFWRMMMKKKILRAPTFVPDLSGQKEAVQNNDDIPF